MLLTCVQRGRCDLPIWVFWMYPVPFQATSWRNSIVIWLCQHFRSLKFPLTPTKNNFLEMILTYIHIYIYYIDMIHFSLGKESKNLGRPKTSNPRFLRWDHPTSPVSPWVAVSAMKDNGDSSSSVHWELLQTSQCWQVDFTQRSYIYIRIYNDLEKVEYGNSVMIDPFESM